ncbi:MAG: AMP-binding protein [Thermodesulfobacteriota bacterium]|nr:AMP-binding protein [Thermodesulfobacteriota bacterium]
MTNDFMQNPKTLPQYIMRNYLQWGDSAVAIRRKEYGVWNEFTWRDHFESIKYFSLGFVSLGLKRDDKVSIVGDSDPEWTWAQMAVMAVGGVVAGIFTDSLPSEVKYIAEHSDSRFMVARDQEQTDKALDIKDELPLLEKIIYWDPKGMRDYDDPCLVYFSDVVKMGREFEKDHPGYFEDLVNKGRGDDVAMIYYTSGTTGLPKGAVRTHKSLLKTIEGALEIFPTRPQDDYVAITPPAWIASLMGEAGHTLNGLIINYPEEPETAMADLREISPLVYGGGPRIWEGMVSLIQAKIIDANIVTRSLYNFFLPIGYKKADLHLKGEKNLFWTGLNKVADILVFGPLRNQLGLRKTKYFYTGSAAISPDTFRYFHAIGCPIRQFYGSTESGSVCGHQGDETNIRFETIGPPLPGVEVRISPEGEIQIKSDGLFSSYYKNPEATGEAIDDGWFRTGDAGYINDEGHIIYIDRLSELGKLGSGANYSPQYIEGSFRFSPYLQEAVTIGGQDRDYLTAILNIDYDTVGRWAEKNRINYTTYVDLSQKEEVAKLILKDVHRVNKVLPEEVKIRKYTLLHKEIDADEAEMTRTRKLRRKLFESKYTDLIKGLYSDADSVNVEAAVTYRDGKTSTVKTALRIWNVE